MGQEIDLLAKYPKTKRDVELRAAEKSEHDRIVARNYGYDFFDGDRRFGYGGYHYHPRFWSEVVQDIIKFYNLTPESKVLDVGCGKGFLVYDLTVALSSEHIFGVDISNYAINNCKTEVSKNLKIGNATKLPFETDTFDLVISINTLHNLAGEDIKQAFYEVSRVTKKHAFITVDAYRTKEEKLLMDQWNLTALTILSVDDWKLFFKSVNYQGDFYWFMP